MADVLTPRDCVRNPSAPLPAAVPAEPILPDYSPSAVRTASAAYLYSRAIQSTRLPDSGRGRPSATGRGLGDCLGPPELIEENLAEWPRPPDKGEWLHPKSLIARH